MGVFKLPKMALHSLAQGRGKFRSQLRFGRILFRSFETIGKSILRRSVNSLSNPKFCLAVPKLIHIRQRGA